MHSFFNKFITRNSSLIQFVKQYDNCLGSREQAERESDAADFHTVIPCATKSSIEAQFQDVYTHQKFREVQAQFRGKANCITRLTNSALGYSVYEVGEQVSRSIFNKFVVTYDSVTAEPSVTEIYTRTMEQEGKEATHTHQEQPRRATFGAKKQEELTAILHRAYDNVIAEMESLKAKRKGTSSLSHEDANLESVNELQSPSRIRTRGRPKNRLGSKLDKQITNATKKKKTKVLSEINLFDAASVVHSNSSQYQGHVMNYQFRVPAAGDNSFAV
ncbi:Protein FAR1-RELATED SEQUENCE [Arachis hypogaea]|nr:Protein FAR1-RELATED SEQUENCE [Arachis hypogaea]